MLLKLNVLLALRAGHELVPTKVYMQCLYI